MKMNVLKNEKDSYSNGNRLHFSKKKNYSHFLFSLFFFFKKKKEEEEERKPQPPFIVVGQPHMAQGVVECLGVAQATPGDNSTATHLAFNFFF
jgi:hypothetical protein